jgi:hypothetical protein
MSSLRGEGLGRGRERRRMFLLYVGLLSNRFTMTLRDS